MLYLLIAHMEFRYTNVCVARKHYQIRATHLLPSMYLSYCLKFCSTYFIYLITYGGYIYTNVILGKVVFCNVA